MRLSLSRSVLVENLQAVVKAIPTKSNISALEGIFLTCDGKNIVISATNLELGISSKFTIEQQEAGKIVLPAKIVEIIRKLPGETVQITVDPENFSTEIVSGQAEFQLNCYNPGEYPSLPQFSQQPVQLDFRIKVADFRRALRQTLFSVSNDDGNLVFTGLLFSLEDEVLTLSASDTFRVATTKCRVSYIGKSGKFLVPAKNLQEVLRIFTEEEETILVVLSQNQVILKCRDKIISSRLLAESFPNIERVIPETFIGRAFIDSLNFMKAVERAALLSEGINHVVRLSIADGTLIIRASSPKYGKTQEKVPLKLEGEGVEISLNSSFILEMLKISEGEQCIIELTGTNRPCLFRDSLHQDYRYLVLPIKI